MATTIGARELTASEIAGRVNESANERHATRPNGMGQIHPQVARRRDTFARCVTAGIPQVKSVSTKWTGQVEG